jgi:nicotinate phosphoribosyltransferase
VSGGINEDVLQTMTSTKAPIDGYGIGVNLDASIDAPSLDCAYKLQEYAGRPRRKLSEGKVTWPGRKQIWRRFGDDGRMSGDTLSLENDSHKGDLLVVPVMRAGKRIAPAPKLSQIREHAARELACLPEPLRRLEKNDDYPVRFSEKLKELAAEITAKRVR